MREQLLSLSHYFYEQYQLQMKEGDFRVLCEELIDRYEIDKIPNATDGRALLKDKLRERRAMLVNLGALPPSPKNYGIRKK
jgi:hypothetical protein